MDDIEVDEQDRKTINTYKGYTVGFNSEEISICEIKNELCNMFKKYFLQAKGILVIYTINQEQNMIDIGEVMEYVSEEINQDCDIILGTETDNKIVVGKCKFHIEITGLNKI